MTAIEWARLSEKLYEDMGSVLLSHLYPTSTRLDGSGGDGGRDVQIIGDDGTDAFELKSFTGRMTSTRRTQVKKSLLKAKGLKPKSWTLIVPIDHTPGELTWFEGLRSLVSFPITWRGRTWLDAQFGERPSIARYFLDDAAHEVIRLAEVLQQEQAVLAGGAPDALARAGRVVEQLNDLDPFYQYELTVGASVRRVSVSPRYQGALVDRPIGATARFVFPHDSAGRAAAEAFERALDFGTAVRVPAQYVEELRIEGPSQLGGTFEKASILMEPIPGEAERRTFILATVAPEGQTLAELPMELERTNSGRSGSIWAGKDRTAALTATFTADIRTRAFNLKLSVHAIPNYYPQDMLPAVRFMDTFVKPNRVEVRLENGDRISELTDVPIERWASPHLRRLIEDLVLVQAAAGVMRKVPDRASVAEMNLIGVAAALLRGESIDLTWDRLPFTAHGDTQKLFQPDFSITLITREPHAVPYGGINYSLGKRARVDYQGRLAGVVRRSGDQLTVEPLPAEWSESQTIPAGTEVMLEPAPSSSARISLVSDAAERTEEPG